MVSSLFFGQIVFKTPAGVEKNNSRAMKGGGGGRNEAVTCCVLIPFFLVWPEKGNRELWSLFLFPNFWLSGQFVIRPTTFISLSSL